MKARLALTMLVCSLLIPESSFAQNEIEKYKLPDIIEGSNLYLSGTPVFFSSHANDSANYQNMAVNFRADYLKWKFTPRIDYSADIMSIGRINWYSANQPGQMFSNSSSEANLHFTGGLDFYPVKDMLYGGFYVNSSSQFTSQYKPISNNNIYGFAGTGRLVNAGQVMYALNFQRVLIDEGLTSKSLPPQVLRKLTVLLDKRRNSEFISKYKDDADIEFFSQIEQMLRDEKVITGPMSSRTTLKLFQALTNSSFVYFPRYRGYMVQAELGFSSGTSDYFIDYSRGNSLRLILSGVYGYPLGLKTDLVFSCFAGIPLNDEPGGLLDLPLFHSPLYLRDVQDPYYPFRIAPIDTERYDFTGGIKLLAYHNISSMFGITGNANFAYGRNKNSGNDILFTANVNLRYNILSKLILNWNAEFTRNQVRNTFFMTGLNISYIVF